MSEQEKNQKSPQALRPSVIDGKSAQAVREEEILKYWEEQDIFNKTTAKDAPKGDFIFFEGPPTANGRPGLHHAEARSFKDIIPRYKTMQGFRVARKAGWDTHGLPVELQVEKALGLKSKKEIETYGIAAFNQKCRESVWEYKDEWERLTKRMGFWVDMQNPYVTYKNSYIEALWSVIKRADERGHLYRDFRVGPWCSRCGTGLSSHELNQPGAYKDVKDLSVYVKFKLKAGQRVGEIITECGDSGPSQGSGQSDVGTYLIAWTTTPWTLPGNVALAVGNEIAYAIVELLETGEKCIVANDLVEKIFEGKEFKKLSIISGEKLIGLTYEPLYPFLATLDAGDEKLNNAFKIYPADFVTTTDGAGIVHTAVMYGADDFELGTAVGLPKFHTVNEEGKFIPGTGFLAGRYVKESDENGKPTLAVDIVNDLTNRNLLWKKENHMHSYPHCWRCDTPLLYYARTSWYFRMSALRDQMMKANEAIGWEPDHVRDGRFGEWLDGIKDWGISRDRYWGTPLPVWTTESGKNVIIGGIDDLKKYAKKSGNKYFVMRHGEANSNTTHVWDFEGDPTNHLTETGKRQVRESAEQLKNKHIDIIVHSPILRTTETAQLVAEGIGFSGEMVVDDRLREFQPGNGWQGRKIHDFLEQYSHYPERFTRENPDGENYRAVKKRVMDTLYDLEKKYTGKNILIVSHGSPVLNLILGSQGLHEQETPNTIEEIAYPKNAEIRELDFVPLPHNENYELDFHKPFIDDVELELDGEKLVRTPEVMDVWFDSGCMPYAQDHVLGTPTNFDPKPADYIAEGLDQTRGWFYTLHAVSNMLHDNPSQAYKNVICMGLLMDANGQKMSKSRGNVVGPWEMFDKYGADTVRLWMYSVNQPGDSKNFDEKGLDEVNKKFFNILRNVVSFYELYRDLAAEEKNFKMENLNVLDSWIITRLFMLTRDMTRWLDIYNITDAARAMRDFVDDLSTWYVRRSRDRFKDGDAAAKQVFYFVLMRFSKLLAPFAPFTAEDIYQKLRHDGRDAESVHLALWPDYVEHENMDRVIESMKQVRRLVTLGLEARQKANIKVRQPLRELKVKSGKLEASYLDILKDELNVKEIVIDEKLGEGEVLLNIEITPELQREGYARELMRALQDMRKKAGLNPTDMIALTVETDDVGRAVIESFQSEIEKVVNVSKLSFESNDGEEVKVDDLVFKVKI